MGLKEGMVQHFMAHAALTALIAERLVPRRLRQATARPNVAFSQIREDYAPGQHLTGSNGDVESLFRFRTAVEDRDQPDVKERAVKEALFAALHPASSGVNGFTGTWDGVTIYRAFWPDSSDEDTEPFAGDDVGIYGTSIDLKIAWKRG